MITLSNKTSVALLILVLKQNYNKAWFSEVGGELVVGLHTPGGDVAYKIPQEYRTELKGMIELTQPDLTDDVTEKDSADRLMEWSKIL